LDGVQIPQAGKPLPLLSVGTPHATVSAYWHIGREVVEALQRGGERAAYGKALIERLAQQLTARYGKGFSATNLGYCRQFYLAYRDRIPHPLGGALQPEAAPKAIPHPVGGELLRSFHPNLSWSHYRALMRVIDVDARHFYETEAVRANWSRRDLERQINSTAGTVQTAQPAYPVTASPTNTAGCTS
jgi:hypothetical protein